MEIPKHIDELIKKRRALSEELNTVCNELDNWLMDNNITPSQDDWLTGCNIYCDPGSAEMGVRNAIKNDQRIDIDRIGKRP